MQRIPMTIHDKIESINLPSMPHVLVHILKVMEDDRASASELATLVGMDPAVNARFLSRSPLSGEREGSNAFSTVIPHDEKRETPHQRE